MWKYLLFMEIQYVYMYNREDYTTNNNPLPLVKFTITSNTNILIVQFEVPHFITPLNIYMSLSTFVFLYSVNMLHSFTTNIAQCTCTCTIVFL